MQLIVVKELSKEKNYWMQVLRNDLQSGGELRELLERYESKKNHSDYQAVMDVVARANWEKLEEERKMCEALKELFAEDFKEATEIGKEIGVQLGKKETALNLCNMGMGFDDIVKAVGETVETVRNWLNADGIPE